MEENAIVVEKLVKQYGKFTALDNMSFEIKTSAITGLIGRNGAGKTTLLKLLAGFYTKTGGTIHIFDEDPFENLNVLGNIIFIDDNMAFPPTFNLGELVWSAAKFYENFDYQLALKLLNYFEISLKNRHQRLSKGTKSVFNMVIGLCARCPLTIFDEPTTGMDAAIRKDFYRALLKDYIEHPRTILISSHLLNEIDDLLENVLLIDKGKTILNMSVVDLKEFSLCLKGNKKDILRVTEKLRVIHQEDFAADGAIAVVINDDKSIKESAEKAGLSVSFTDINDLCIYLTDKNKGGIDHVFRKN